MLRRVAVTVRLPNQERISLPVKVSFEVLFRVRIGHGRPEKSWNLGISFSRSRNSWTSIFGRGKSWKTLMIFVIP